MMPFRQKMSFCRKEKKFSRAEPGKSSGFRGDIKGMNERDEMKPSIETEKNPRMLLPYQWIGW